MESCALSVFVQLGARPARPSDQQAVQKLLRDNGLEADFVASEFQVVEDFGSIVACERLRRLPEGGVELASVAVVAGRRGEALGDLVTRGLLKAVRPGVGVYALALAPGFFARHRFDPIVVEQLPESLLGKARGLCASKGFVAMRRMA